MDNNQLMNMMMQMMMQNNQMMSMMMAQMMPQQNAQIAANTTSPTINFESNGTTNEMDSQIQALYAQIEALKSELATTKQELATAKSQLSGVQAANKELNALKSTITKAEAYLGQSIEDIAAQGENLSGDDYYDEKKKEWDKEGISNKEKHERIKSFKDVYKTEEEDPWGPMIEF